MYSVCAIDAVWRRMHLLPMCGPAPHAAPGGAVTSRLHYMRRPVVARRFGSYSNMDIYKYKYLHTHTRTHTRTHTHTHTNTHTQIYRYIG